MCVCSSKACVTFETYGLNHDRELDQLDKVTYSVKAHESLINCIDGAGGVDCQSGPPEIVTGSRDGKSILEVTNDQS